SARNIAELPYEAAAAVACSAARRPHARSIGAVRGHRISLRAKNIFKPRDPGTLVHRLAPARHHATKARPMIQDRSRCPGYRGPLTGIASLIDRALSSTSGSHTEVMISSQSSTRTFVCFIIPTTVGPEALRATQNNLLKCLQEVELHTIWQINPVSVITVVGE